MKLSNLADVLRSYGLTVVETAGWATRGYLSQDLKAVAGVLWHHTATNRNAFTNADAPTLAMCINGRSDLAGPLCNIVFGRDGTVYLVAAGVANHAGAGSAEGIPTNEGNHYLVGIEMESSGIAPWDWTADQLRVAPYLGAALEKAYGASLQLGHLEYSSQGKIDPAGWPGGMDGLRESINAVLSGGTISTQGTTTTTIKEWDEMASKEEIFDAVWGGPGTPLIHNNELGRGEYPRTILGAMTDRIVRQQIVPLRQEVASQNAQINNLISALANVSKGEAFDQAKLLAGVQAAAAEGVKSAISSIDATVTIKKG